MREVTLGAHAHQDIPFEKLVEELRPERSLSHSPIFQVVFTLVNAKPTPSQLPGLSLTSFGVESTTAKFDLTLQMAEGAEGLAGALEYNTDLFDAAAITRLGVHFKTLVEAIVADPEQRVSELSHCRTPSGSNCWWSGMTRALRIRARKQ